MSTYVIVALPFPGKCKELFASAVFIVLFRQGIHCFIWSYQHSQSSKLSFFYMEFDTWFAISMKILEPIICTKLLILTYKSIFCLLIYNI